MKEVITKAIVLKASDLSEYDRSVRLFTLEGGIIQAVMKGVKRPSAKLKFAAQPFAFCEFSLSVKNGRFTVINARQIESLFKITLDTDKLLAGCVMLETSDISIGEIPSPSLFIKLLKALNALLYETVDPFLAASKYLLAVLDEQGYRGVYIKKEVSSLQGALYALQHAPLSGLNQLGIDGETSKKTLKALCKECQQKFFGKINSAGLI